MYLRTVMFSVWVFVAVAFGSPFSVCVCLCVGFMSEEIVGQCGPQGAHAHTGQSNDPISRLPEPLWPIQDAKPLIPRRQPHDVPSLLAWADASSADTRRLRP